MLSVVFPVYLLCFALHTWEYFVLRTDQSILGEAFIHKLLGIVILFIVVKLLSITASDVGFTKEKPVLWTLRGLLFGLCMFVVAYSAEAAISAVSGNSPSLRLYVSAFAIDGNIGERTEFIFYLFCIVGNIINVIMEEGVFRGLFGYLLQKKYTFMVSAIIASCLFGLWHIIGPLRNYCDGLSSTSGFIANCIMMIAASTLVGFKFAMMTKLTGSIYMAMGDHFVNNTIVNILHLVTSSGTDELMFIRITIAQALSFCIVLLWYLKSVKSGKRNTQTVDTCKQ